MLNDTPGIGVNAQTREAVLHAIAELNYHVDAQACSMTLAAIGDTRHPLFMHLLVGMQQADITFCFAHRGSVSRVNPEARCWTCITSAS
ncbi:MULTISPECIES: hypothetical protein [unclassified Paenibacillus]|uniref:hypothetical protein n=1 Tax=unclassified Paenibacillus TaxID=185978 RepID=UPI00240541F8|nr:MULTISPECIES: hypothetical protein [unclassified Paenibacillus]MDF9839266.1 hypothetical protein [Paenibacillus sp. PastF-2]MDF9845847.1 hypothetical protein [Paenibacillus sp. PastM-2]MDF9852420.1 hypothetical protein [Paenibacillus sp. PastF-1]MDH6477850.1 hypothetical protein [Paenibacillus sp. PastH-2]MDH6505589.1 hypothetical protein [Paenibacillus sp. PastM-3]